MEATKIINNLIEKTKLNLIKASSNVNEYADRKDTGRDSVNYGIAINCASVLKDLGQEVSLNCWSDNGYLRISFLSINGKQIMV